MDDIKKIIQKPTLWLYIIGIILIIMSTGNYFPLDVRNDLNQLNDNDFEMLLKQIIMKPEYFKSSLKENLYVFCCLSKKHELIFNNYINSILDVVKRELDEDLLIDMISKHDNIKLNDINYA